MKQNPIGWCDDTINPIVGCSKCSPGCQNCYAEKFAARLAKNPKTAKKYAGVVDENGKWNGSVRYHVSWYEQLPKKPKRIFLNSMSDFFHPAVIEEDLHEILDLIVKFGCQHTFLVLTKRPERARDMLACRALPPNVWLGVTVCNQEEADAKIPVLLQIPAAKRFISIEPMLGQVDLACCLKMEERHYQGDSMSGFTDHNPLLHWVICGGETGPGARPMHPEWARSLRGQCQSAGVPFYFKGWGGWMPCDNGAYQRHMGTWVNKRFVNGIGDTLDSSLNMSRINAKVFGHNLLDGQEWLQFPEAR